MATTHSLYDQSGRDIKVKVDITYAGAELGEIDKTADEENRVSQLSQVSNLNSVIPYKYFALHDNTLDGTYHPASPNDDYEIGWWGNTLANGSGYLPSAMTITLEFEPRGFTQLRVKGDDKTHISPREYQIKLYQAGDTLVHTETVSTTEDDYSVDITLVEDIVKYELIITRITRGNKVPRVTEIFLDYSETYYDGDVVSVSLLEEVEYFSGGLPIGTISSNEVDVELNNVDREFDYNSGTLVSSLMKNNRIVEVALGIYDSDEDETIWSEMGRYYTWKWSSQENSVVASVSNRDLLERMRTSEFATSELFEDYTMYELFEFILQDYGLSMAEYSIDNTLNDVVIPYAWFELTTHREALRQLAEASLVKVYMDRNNVLQIKDLVPDEDIKYLFTPEANYFDKTFPQAWADLANSILIDVVTYEYGSSSEVINDTTIHTIDAGDTRVIIYPYSTVPCKNVADPTITYDTGITVDLVEKYAWGLRVTVSNSTGSDLDITSIVTTGTPLNQVSSQSVLREDTSSINTNGKTQVNLSSRFFQSISYAKELVTTLLSESAVARVDIELDSRGCSELSIGDRVWVKGVDGDYMVIRQEFDYEGSLSSMVTLRKITDRVRPSNDYVEDSSNYSADYGITEEYVDVPSGQTVAYRAYNTSGSPDIMSLLVAINNTTLPYDLVHNSYFIDMYIETSQSSGDLRAVVSSLGLVFYQIFEVESHSVDTWYRVFGYFTPSASITGEYQAFNGIAVNIGTTYLSDGEFIAVSGVRIVRADEIMIDAYLRGEFTLEELEEYYPR